MDQTSQIREKIDLVSLISEYIPLKKAGRNLKTNCPFHNEKTPSFVVSPERQIWHCFGCGKGGDCFTFLMEYENLEFLEALRILAKKTGIELLTTPFESGAASKKERLFSLNSLACEFYHYVLTKHNVGKKALTYLLEKRRLNLQIINTFKLGFSPSSGDALVNYLLNKKKYKKEDLIDAGLTIYKKGKIVDFFANRLMFPLFDHRDNVVGFSGRVIDSFSLESPKYVNTRETFVYHKSDVFFGLNIAKEAIKKEDTAIITEGEFDVISCFQEGIKNIVAVKGTALTDNQVNLISRYTQKVSLCFDQDSAGIEAIKRSLLSLEKKGLITTVVVTSGKDPDDSIKSNPFEFKKAVKNSLAIYDYLLELSFKNFDKQTIEGKKKISDELLPLISLIENEIVKEHYLKKLGEKLNVSYESVVRQLEKIGKKEVKDLVLATPQSRKKDRGEILEEYLLALIIQAKDAKLYLEKTSEILFGISFKISSLQKIMERLLIYFKNQKNLDAEKFLRGLPLELVPSFDVCFLLPLPKFEEEEKYKQEIIKIAKELKTLHLKNKIKVISEKIKLKEKNPSDDNQKNQNQVKLGQNQELEFLRKELSELLSLLKKC